MKRLFILVCFIPLIHGCAGALLATGLAANGALVYDAAAETGLEIQFTPSNLDNSVKTQLASAQTIAFWPPNTDIDGKLIDKFREFTKKDIVPAYKVKGWFKKRELSTESSDYGATEEERIAVEFGRALGADIVIIHETDEAQYDTSLGEAIKGKRLPPEINGYISVKEKRLIYSEKAEIIFDILGHLPDKNKIVAVYFDALAHRYNEITAGYEKISNVAQRTYEQASLQSIDDVKNVQSLLNSLGYSAGPVDGISGKKTVNALRVFQKEQGLAATGGINQETIDSLVAAVNLSKKKWATLPPN